MERTPSQPGTGGLSAQAVATGVSAALIGYASAISVVITGLSAVGASTREVGSGLLAMGVAMGVATVAFSWWTRLPVSIVWSTPGVAVLAGVGVLDGGFPVVVGALLVTAALLLLTGLISPLTRAFGLLPPALTSAVLAGVLLPFCLRPARSVQDLPLQAGSIAVVWVVVHWLAPRWSAPAALAALVVVVLFAGEFPTVHDPVPHLVLVTPAFSWEAVLRISLPLYLVTMAGQNLVGAAVLTSFGYRPPLGRLLVGTGAASAAAAPFGSPSVNLAAITGALTAGPHAHPDPARRWVATATSGVTCLLLALVAPLTAAVVTGVDARLVATVAGLALLGALGSAAAGALRDDATRLPALGALLVSASGISGAPAFGLAVGLLLLWLDRHRPTLRT